MLRRRSIRLRILVLVLVPVVALIGLYAVVLSLTLGSFLTLSQANSVQTQITRPVSNLQAQLTTERMLAMQYMADPGQSQLTPLLGQERRTDSTVKIFLTAASSVTGTGTSPAELHAINTWRNDLATLNELRTSVSNLGASRLSALTAYSSIISDGDLITNQAILPLVTGTVGIQANDIIDMERSAQAFAEESDLLGTDLATHTLSPADRQLFSQLAVLRQEIYKQTLPGLDPAYQAYFAALIPAGASAHLVTMENAVISHGVTRNKLVSLRSWISTVRSYGAGLQAALLKSGNALQASAQAQASSIALRLILIGGLGLLAIAVAVAIAAAVSRGLVRQLNELRMSALDLSGHRLPSTIERLRAGEDIDVDAEVPDTEPSPDEIGQVRRAFDTVQRSALASAVDENRIRRGVNDVFRNLARRSQSLLTRQLQLLDAMERRIDDPDELADLFKIDHLTTRMRRHAEGLLIVAGDSSGRSWREPVPLVDVIRAAIAEVEDYTRIRVMSRCGAAVAGHAVADVIHLIAELLENATMFSPANTPVRVDGDMVARGLAIEIEDRGLGMSDAQLVEINRKLASPPVFDLSGSDQLGLFIAGQLARRHDIKITLRSSAFGGTAAVILIPRALVIPAAGDAEPLATSGVRELGGRPVPQLLAAVPSVEIGAGYLADYASGVQNAAAGAVVGTGTQYEDPASDAVIAARVIDLMNSPAATGDTGTWPGSGARSGGAATADDAGTWPGSGARSGGAATADDAGTWPGTIVRPGYPAPAIQDASAWSGTSTSPSYPAPANQDASTWSGATASPSYPAPAIQDASTWSGTSTSPSYPAPANQDASAWSGATASPSYPAPAIQDASTWSGTSTSPSYPAPANQDASAWSGTTGSPSYPDPASSGASTWSGSANPGQPTPAAHGASAWSGATGSGQSAAAAQDADASAETSVSSGYFAADGPGLWSAAGASPGPESPAAPGQDASAWARPDASPGNEPAAASDASSWSPATSAAGAAPPGAAPPGAAAPGAAPPGSAAPAAAAPAPAEDSSAWAAASTGSRYRSPSGQDTSAWSAATITPGYPASTARDTSAWSGTSASSGQSARGTGLWPASRASHGSEVPPTSEASPWSGASTGFSSHAASWPDPDAPALPTRRRAEQVPRPGGNGGSSETPASRPDAGRHQGDPVELPTRVRQASLAPQLRDQFASPSPGHSDGASEISPEAARNTMSALQKGWERGRSVPAFSTPQESSASAGQADDDAADGREQRAEEGN